MARRTTAVPRIDNFAETIVTHLTDVGDILEIGAGDGALATALVAAGHRVVAIDRSPREGFPALATSFEAYDAGEARFDAVVAQLVLHHADDLDAFIAKMAALTKPNGIVALDDYGWERSDDEHFRAERKDLHTSEHMLAALDGAFVRLLYRDHAYSDEGAGTDRLGFTYVGRPLR
jgi:2-polyprenyl-3-methyl-5-hydroxy-6-metoxy-1,4-benzoquinol methylase